VRSYGPTTETVALDVEGRLSMGKRCAVGFTRGLDERLWHLDLDRVVTERGGMREVFERLMGSLRPAPPEPAGGVISGRALLG